MAGDEQTGVSIMRLTAGLDAGRSASGAPSRSRRDDDYGDARGAPARSSAATLLVRALDERPPLRRAVRGGRHLRREDHGRGPHARPRGAGDRARARRARAAPAHRRAPARSSDGIVPRRPRARASARTARSSCSRSSRPAGARWPTRTTRAGTAGEPPAPVLRPRGAMPVAPPAAPRTPSCCARSPTAPTPTARCTARRRGLAPRDRALAKQLAFGTVQRRGTLDWVIARTADGRLEPRVRAALQLGLFQLLFLDGVRRARGGRRGRRAGQAERRAPARQRRAAPRRARGRRAALRRRPRRARRSRHSPSASGSCACGGTGSAPTRRARCWRPTTSPPSSRCASTRSSTFDLGDVPGRREGETIVVDGPFDALAHPGYAAGAFTPQSRASAARGPRRSRPRPASACSTSARPRAARRRTSPRSWAATARSWRSSATPAAPARCGPRARGCTPPP